MSIKKSIKCRLLALLVSLAIVMSICPVAFADNPTFYTPNLITFLKALELNESSEAEGDIEKELKITVVPEVNRFLNENGIAVSQNQYDALCALTYDEGASWQNKNIGRYLINGIGNYSNLQVVNAFAQLSHRISDYAPMVDMLRRRILEAELFTNGIYNVPEGRISPNYKWLICYPNGGTMTYSDIYVYRSGTTYNSLPPATKDGTTLKGWKICATETAAVSEQIYLNSENSADENYQVIAEWNDRSTGKNPGMTENISEEQPVEEPETPALPDPSPSPSQRPTVPISFSDVKTTNYYHDAVQWAVDNGVTSGTSKTTFSPNNPCTRAQVVTFLWRVNGSPRIKATNNPFKDVRPGDYYYIPVLWAVSKGITAGTSATTFGSGAPCTRGQVMTFLWRNNNSPVVNSVVPFKDVSSKDYYYQPVQWAVSKKITSGTSNTTFSPKTTCTRAHVVTFLHKYSGGKTIPQPVEVSHSAYDPIISNTIKLLQGQTYDKQYAYEAVMFHYVKGQSNIASKVGYCLVDLDYDGTEELLIGDISAMEKNDQQTKDFYRYFWLLYTIENGKAKLVKESWERSRNYLGSDGFIYNSGSGGAAYSMHSKLKFRSNNTYTMEAAFTDLNANNKICYCYKNFGLGVKGEPTLSMSNADRTNLSEREWMSIVNGWETKYMSITYKPLSAYK